MRLRLRSPMIIMFLLDTIFIWLVIILSGHPASVMEISHSLMVYIIYICSLYSFRSYEFLRFMKPYDCISGTFKGALIGGSVNYLISVFSISYLPANLNHLLLLGGMVFFPLERFVIWQIYDRFIEPVPMMVVGSRDKWENILCEMISTINNKILIVGYCDPEIYRFEEFLKLNPNISLALITEERFLNEPLVRKKCLFLLKKNIDIMFLPHFAENLINRIPLDIAIEFNNYYELIFNQKEYDPRKRIFEVVFSIFAIIAASPLMLMISLVILLESGLPIIFSQQRTGLDGKPFVMHKFRTMYKPQDLHKPDFATNEVFRITRSGHFIRATHMDELPQLFDVLLGNMSLIAPRPEQTEFATEYSDKIPFYHYRHRIPPGITGWAQINYQYSSCLAETISKVEYDLFYIKNHTLFLDMKILLKTVETVLSIKGLEITVPEKAQENIRKELTDEESG